MSQIIVLGWDALDIELIHKYGLQGRFGSHERRIDTYVNPAIDEPHTKELWPSMITGLHPDEHGIHAAIEGDGVAWDSTTLRVAASLANGVVPDDLKTLIGRKLRENGIGLETTAESYYSDNNIQTVFDSGGKAISIPNYQTESDKSHGFDANRDKLWKALQVDKSLEKGMRPTVDKETLHRRLTTEVGSRVGPTIQAINSGESLVWTWFGLIDTVGHMQPALGESLVEQYYRVAANITETIQEIAPEATIVSVSDHGLQNGTHEHYATICSDAALPPEVSHVFDLYDWIQANRETSTAKTNGVDPEDVQDVEDQLEHLGYV
jgi:predicted AlkP superfamily pyrophosphatase or phosphodiesterase